MRKIANWFGGIVSSAVRLILVSATAITIIATPFAIADYSMTQGSGTTFGSIVVATVHYAQQLLCDPTTPSQCAAVDASGRMSVTGTGGTFPATQSGTWTVQPGNTANTTPWLASVSVGGNTAAVKAASTAPVAADPALVVATSPNSAGIIQTTAPGVAPSSGNTVQVQGASGGIALPASQSGTWTVQPGNTPNTTAWLVTGTGGTFPQPASELHLGEIGSNQIRVDVAQTVTASSAYTSGNAVGGLMTVANAARVSGSLGAAGTGGLLQQVAMNSKSVQTAEVDVFIFNSNPTGSTCTDKTAFVLATADFDKVIGVAKIPGTFANGSGWVSGGTGSVGQAMNLAMAYDLSSATSLYACAVVRGTPTFTATSDISFKYQFLRN